MFCLRYIRYSQICAQTVRNALKAEYQEAAQARNQKTVIFRKWENGKPQGAFTTNGKYRIVADSYSYSSACFFTKCILQDLRISSF